MSVRASRRVAGVVAGAAALIGVLAPATGAQASSGVDVGERAQVDGSTPGWATPQAKLSEVHGGQQRHVQVALALRDQRDAEQLAKAISTPGSPQYGHHLSSTEFTDRFAATRATVEKVSAWLRSQGLQVDGVSANRHFINATGSVDTLERAFGTQLSTYQHTTSDGRALRLIAPEKPISIPRAVRSSVTAVLGLDDTERMITPQHTARTAPKPPTAPHAKPSVGPKAAAQDGQYCAHYWGEYNNAQVPQRYGDGQQSNVLCGYDTAQTRAIYGLNGANTGAGNTVAVVGAYHLDSIVADTNRAAASFGSPPLASGQYSAVLPAGYIDQNQCAPESWVGEQALDVQAIHTLAPAAQITYYGASSCLTLIDALNTAVAENKASVISNSWLYPGESMVPAANRQQLDSIAVQAAIQGQALLFSSGDSGDNSAAAASGRHEASFPASSPWVTAVGGTSVAVDGANKVSFSTGWEGSGNTLQGGQWASQRDADGRFVGGAGGGVSGMYDLPDYQKGKVPAGTKGRAIPDISALADAYTGMAIGYTAGGAGYVEFAGGGTSLAAPLLAGLVADAQQAQRVTRMGFLNEAIYVLSDKPAITDVIAVKAGVWTPSMISYGYVSVPSGQGDYLIDLDSKPQSLQSATGWDAVTGVGTPTAAFLTQLGK